MNAFDDLRRHLRGRVLLPGEHGFDQARQPWNTAVDQPVPAVVEAADAADIAALVRYARDRGISVTAQPSGHGAVGADLEQVVLLRTTRLDEVTVDPAARTARVGAGVKWGQVQRSAGQYGLTGLPGSSSVVSVVGYTLGGGLSWFSRRYGWAADSVTAFDIVDADGHAARVTADSEADLFWALRGGGGDFAIVTAVEFDLHPAPALYGGRMLWPADQGPRVLEAFRQITSAAPGELTVWADLLHLPGALPMVSISTTYLGDADTARELLKPFDGIDKLISDSRAPMPISDLGSITGEPTGPSPGLSLWELLTDLDDVAAKTLLGEPIEPLRKVQIRHLGGALAAPSDSPYGPLAEPYALYFNGNPATPEIARAVRDKQQGVVQQLGPYVGGRKPYSALTPGESAAAAFPAETMTRLQGIKRRRDPNGVIRANFPITT